MCALINPSKNIIRHLSDDLIVSFVEMASVSNEGYIETMIDKQLGKLRKGSYTYFGENDILIAKITPCMENGKCAIAKGLTNQIGMGSSEFHIFRADETKILTEFLFYALNRKEIREIAEKSMTGSSGHRRVPISFYEKLQIPVPPIETQQKIVSEIEGYEAEIKKLEEIMLLAGERKKAVLEKYL